MHTCSTARRIAREPATDPLTVVAELIDGATHEAAHPERPGGAAAAEEGGDRIVFGACFEPDGIELSVRPIEGHPTDELIGFLAPATWSCIGVASGAWASTYDGAGRRASTATDRRRVRLVHAVERSGASISIFRDGAAPPSVQRCAHPSTERAGALDDHLRRALAIPTPAPGSTLEYFALRWIDDIFRDAVAGRLEQATWRDLAVRHQVHHFVVDASDPALRTWAIDRLVRAGELLADAKPWSAVRAAMIEWHEQDGRPDDVALEHLRWMDDGIFSRTLLGRYPPLEDLLVDLHDLLPADAYVQLVDTVDAWGLLHGATDAAHERAPGEPPGGAPG